MLSQWTAWKGFLKRPLFYGLVSVLFVALTILYLYPGSLAFDRDAVIGIGQDDTTLPYYYDYLSYLWKSHPWLLANGAVFSPAIAAPIGSPLWIPGIERIFALLATGVTNPDHRPAWFLIFLLSLNGMTAFAFARLVRMERWVAVLFGIAFAYQPYLLWRAKIHFALAGVFTLPLLASATWIWLQARNRRAWCGGLFCLLGTLLAAHYQILIVLSLIPVLLFFLVKRRKNEGWTFWKPMSLCGGIFLAALVWVKTPQIFSWRHLQAEAPTFTQPLAPDPHRHWDVLVYSAQAIDYWTGYFDPDFVDWNPLRRKLTAWVQTTSDPFYPQERSSGIRWSVLLGAMAVVVWYFRRRWYSRASDAQSSVKFDAPALITLGLLFAVAGFLYSLSPRAIAPLGRGIAPSGWIHALIPEMRAPNRWSIAGGFGILLLAFTGLQSWVQQLRQQGKKMAVVLLTCASFATVFLEFPPTGHFPMRPSQAAFPMAAFAQPTSPEKVSATDASARTPPAVSDQNLSLRQNPQKNPQYNSPVRTLLGPLGISLPYFRNDDLRTYRAIERLKTTSLRLVNAQPDPRLDRAFEALLGEKVLPKNSQTSSNHWQSILSTLDCLGIQWIHWDREWDELAPWFCTQFGFKLVERDFCVREKAPPMTLPLATCLKMP